MSVVCPVVSRCVVSPVDPAALDDGGLVAELRALAAIEASVAARRAAVVAERQRRQGDAVEVLASDLRLGVRAARAEVEVAHGLERLPATAGALAAGTISLGHARVLAVAGPEVDESVLLPLAADETVDAFARTVRRHQAAADGDDGLARFRRQRRARRAALFEGDDGMWILSGRFDPVAGAAMAAALGARADGLWRAEGGGGMTTPAQRLADALEALVTGVGESPGRIATTLLVTADYDAAAGRLGDARLVDGTPLAAATLARLACEAEILPAIFDARGEPLWLGRRRRLPSRAQRLAVIARDRTCIACDTRADFCQLHHVRWWSCGGPTDVDNLCLLCSRHHHLVHEGGWRVESTAEGFELRGPAP